jgi:2-C-methyl-D-erythritol 4-phosphate cytidylyltransferase
MPALKLSIEGKDATVAVEKLFAIANLKGDWVIDSASKKEGSLAVIATIVGIIGGTMAIAEQLRKWYQEYKKPNKKLDVVLIADGVRLLLEDATLEDICVVLEELRS